MAPWPVRMSQAHYNNILVRATNWIGDAVMSLPALQALRNRFPDSHVSILARPWVADLYRREPFCDELIPYEALRGWRGLGQMRHVAADLRARNFDCAILLQNAFEAALLVRLARIPVRIGYDRDARGALLTQRIRVPKGREIPRHQRFYYLELLRRARLIESYTPDSTVAFTRTGEELLRGRELFRQRNIAGAVIGISPGAAFGGAKRWLPERFAEASIIAARERGASVAIFGSKDEAELGEHVSQLIARSGIPVHNFAGQTTLCDFVDMASACELFLTNDSGSMHIASALGVPTVVVFGPTDEFATGPAGYRYKIIREPVECAPCHLRECPIDHRCMTRVTADRAAQAAADLLKQVS